jgi:hypothetical protein
LNKLGLTDLLIQPLHRITRYPILLKRLYSLTSQQSREYEPLGKAIQVIEENNNRVNEVVRKNEALYNCKLIEDKMDLNGIIEVRLGGFFLIFLIFLF